MIEQEAIYQWRNPHKNKWKNCPMFLPQYQKLGVSAHKLVFSQFCIPLLCQTPLILDHTLQNLSTLLWGGTFLLHCRTAAEQLAVQPGVSKAVNKGKSSHIWIEFGLQRTNWSLQGKAAREDTQRLNNRRARKPLTPPTLLLLFPLSPQPPQQWPSFSKPLVPLPLHP